MPPPDPIQSANASYGICLPDGTEQEIEILISPAAPQQFSEGNQPAIEGVPDLDTGMSYAQPVTLSRQPTNVFDASPIQVQAKQKRTLVALGDALQTWMNQQEAQGNLVDPQLEDLAQLLHKGKLPDAKDPDFQNLTNKSFADIGLDAIIHAIALEADQSPNRALHAQALRYSFQYYCQHNTQNPADNTIRQSLVTALSNSNNSDSRSILAEVGRNSSTPPNVQQQIQSSLSGNATYHASNNEGSVNPTPSMGVSPSTQAAYLADMAVNAAQITANPVATNPNRLTRFLLSTNNPVIEGGIVLATTSSHLATAPVIAPLLVATAPTIQNSEHNTGALANTAHTEANIVNHPETPLANVGSAKPETVLATNNSPLTSLTSGETAHPISGQVPAEASPAHRFLQFLGFSDSSVQNIVSTLPSPFVTAFAAMMGGAQHSTATQINPAAPILFASNTYAISAYNVRPVSASASADSGYEGFGESREGFSQGHSGQGSGGDNPQHDNPEQANPADVYSNNLA